MALALDGLRVIDADTHLTEAHDLWTKRAPAKYAERVPHVEVVDGRPMWFVDGSEMGFAGGGGVIDRQGGKGRALEALYEWTQDDIHLGAFDPKARIEVMEVPGNPGALRAVAFMRAAWNCWVLAGIIRSFSAIRNHDGLSFQSGRGDFS